MAAARCYHLSTATYHGTAANSGSSFGGSSFGGASSSAEPCVCIDVPSGCNPHLDRYLAPRPLAEGTLTCRVRTSDKGMSMHIEEGNALLLMARQKGRDWIVYSDAVCSDSCIIAKLRQHKDGTFTCVRERSVAQSTGMWESLVVRHATHSVSESLPELNTLSGALPPEAEQASSAASGADDIWELPPGELASRLRQATESHGRAARNGPAQLFEIVTKLPKWNGRTQSFELAFHGRAKLASERNLQLIERFPRGKERLLLLCGKLEEDEYAVDFAHPLSPVHAFALFLCTAGW